MIANLSPGRLYANSLWLEGKVIYMYKQEDVAFELKDKYYLSDNKTKKLILKRIKGLVDDLEKDLSSDKK